MAKIIVKSPTRVDLAGGTLDLWPIYCLLGTAVTTNIAIDIFTTVELEELESTEFEIELVDRSFKKVFKSLNSLLEETSEEVAFIRPHLEYWKPQKGLRIKLSSESPIGGGLGGSSSLTAGLTKAFVELNKKKITSEEIVTLCANIEAQVLKTPTGTQDYVAAVYGGMNLIHYRMSGMQVQGMDFSNHLFDDRAVLVYTGQPHHSGLNNWEVLKAAIEGDANTLQCLTELQKVAMNMHLLCLEKKWDDLGGLFDLEYKWRVQLAKVFTSDKIEELKNLVSENSWGNVKICGAGGGGCVLIWANKDCKGKVIQACEKNGFQVLSAQFVAEKQQVIT